MRRSKSNLNMLAAIVAMAAAGGMSEPPKYRIERKSDRMDLTDEERAHLETLEGKEKKSYVKSLREKYK